MKKRKMIVVAVAVMVSVPLVSAEFPHGDEWGQRFAAPDGFAFERKAEKVKTEERDGMEVKSFPHDGRPERHGQDRVQVESPLGVKIGLFELQGATGESDKVR